MIGRGIAAALTLGVFGIILIWKGLTNDVMSTRLGDVLIPRWMYLVGGLVLLAFPAMRSSCVRRQAGHGSVNDMRSSEPRLARYDASRRSRRRVLA